MACDFFTIGTFIKVVYAYFPKRKASFTRERSRVAARARQLKRDKKVKDTWVRDGEIYVKKNDDSINKLSTSRQLDVFG